MKNVLRFLLRSQIQGYKLVQSQKGFTLIELLVAMILAFLVITPLLGFMIDVMNTDRKEQAKVSSEQEIQSALDYIARDMEQAIYIYDADGMYGNTTKGITGIINQLPNSTETTKVPILVFWKRYFLNKDQDVTVGSTQRRAGCLVNLPNPTGGCNEQDYMLYSLVVYYLIKDNSPTWNTTTTRIARWEIRDGIRDAGGSESRSETINGITKTVNYILLPSPGFMPFNLSLEGDLSKKLGNWSKHSDAYNLATNQLTTLVDFIDQTTTTQGAPAPVACNTAAGEQQVPNYSASGFPDALKTGSFYACVNSKKYVARLYIRGNALARIETDATYNSNKSIYFPTASIQIKGRGFLGVE
jgi:type II secretory pathway pseudopilin PulG